jgi:hypothetical protein
MRKPQRILNKQQTSFIKSVSAPVGGLNARDPVAEMNPKDAVILDNFFCTPYDVTVRQGYSNQATGFVSPVNTLASYSSISGNPTLFAFSGSDVYNITSSGAIGSPVLSGNSNSTFQTTMFGTSGGLFLVAVNGVDLPLVYNGTVWSNVFSAAFTTTISSLTSVGVTATCTMTTPHNLKTGMSVTIAGCTPAGYNGTYVITVTTSTAFTYTLAGALGVVTVIGTATPTLNVTVTGVNPARFTQVLPFKSRFWAIEKDTSKAWYLPAISIGGAAASLDLSSLFTLGGYLVSMSSWSLDGGQGLDDYIAFISSNGQVVVYKGTDPASASTFAMVGVFNLGSPIGNKCFSKLAGDVLVITEDGLVPLSQALISDRVTTEVAVTDKVRSRVSNSISLYGSLYGWETIVFPKQNMLLLNVPTSATTSIQYVTNTISKAWSTFSGWNARCWVLHNDEIYFGGVNFVAKAWSTYADNGAAINIEAQQSFNYFGSEAQLKHVKMARPIIATDGTPALLFGVNVDFDQTVPTGVPSFTSASGATWDTGIWDIGIWGGDPVIKKDWQNASAIGYCVAAHLVGQVLGSQLRWSSTDYLLESGGVV